jgi:hypothetical protein
LNTWLSLAAVLVALGLVLGAVVVVVRVDTVALFLVKHQEAAAVPNLHYRLLRIRLIQLQSVLVALAQQAQRKQAHKMEIIVFLQRLRPPVAELGDLTERRVQVVPVVVVQVMSLARRVLLTKDTQAEIMAEAAVEALPVVAAQGQSELAHRQRVLV